MKREREEAILKCLKVRILLRGDMFRGGLTRHRGLDFSEKNVDKQRRILESVKKYVIVPLAELGAEVVVTAICPWYEGDAWYEGDVAEERRKLAVSLLSSVTKDIREVPNGPTQFSRPFDCIANLLSSGDESDVFFIIRLDMFWFARLDFETCFSTNNPKDTLLHSCSSGDAVLDWIQWIPRKHLLSYVLAVHADSPVNKFGEPLVNTMGDPYGSGQWVMRRLHPSVPRACFFVVPPEKLIYNGIIQLACEIV